MKTIIAGGRDITDIAHVMSAINNSGFKITEVISGGAPGVDRLGMMWVQNQNKTFNSGIGLKVFEADWKGLNHPEAVVKQRQDGSYYNAAAGPIRNKQMADYAEALILVWDGQSNGSADMLRKATEKGLKIYQHIVK